MRRRPTFTRADRISSLMRDEVKRIIEFELSSPIARHVHVTDTKLAADMGHLRIRFVMEDRTDDDQLSADEDGLSDGFTPILADGSAEKAQVMLDRSAGYVARVLCRVLQLRKAPKIVFSYDKEYDQMKRVRVLLIEERRQKGLAQEKSAQETSALASDAAADIATSPDDGTGTSADSDAMVDG